VRVARELIEKEEILHLSSPENGHFNGNPAESSEK
jgi:hypothetical protein